MQQMFFTITYLYTWTTLVDEQDKGVRLPTSKGQLTATPIEEELQEFMVTDQTSTPNPRWPKGEAFASPFYQHLELHSAVMVPDPTEPCSPSRTS